ncbi:glycerol transporter [Microbotryomycetes sp. JL221]|nr:glycerol transporter [Microbotryomycetes sp. JL221]
MSGPPSPTPRHQQDSYMSTTTRWRRAVMSQWPVTNLTVDVPAHQQHRPTTTTHKAGDAIANGGSDPRAAVTSTMTAGTGTPQDPLTRSPPEPRWHTTEFKLYYAVFIVVVPAMVRAATQLSRVKHPTYFLYAHRLAPGWMFGWQVDQSDDQWYTVRSHLPMLAALLVLWLLLSALHNLISNSTRRHQSRQLSSHQREPDTTVRMPPRAKFILTFAIVLLTALHGTSMPKMLIILWINYQIALTAAWGRPWTKLTPLLTWGFNLAVLFSNEVFEGYKWSWIGLAVLDDEKYHGILPRWHINWNITMLRLISFNLDYYWATTSHPPPPPPLDGHLTEKSEKTSAFGASSTANNTTTRSSPSSTSHPLQMYSFSMYLTYALYPPLYLAGPIITFNSFVSQLVSPPLISRKLLLGYATRFLVCLLTMELVTHSMYVVAIKDESRGGLGGAWDGATPFQLSMVGFWNLIVVWLKLLIPWRFFRLWALLDGIDPPENMVRCMANNYSTMGFWRSWHRSFNLWTVRYLYIPLGGSSRALLSTLTVFTFVALWHDLSLKLLTWGWVITLFVIPEMLAKKLLPYNKFGSRPWYRHVAAFGGVLNVLMMMTGNLIGFAIGTDGMKYMWQQIIGTWAGIRFMIVAMGCLFVAVQVMFEYREEERRRGISRKC